MLKMFILRRIKNNKINSYALLKEVQGRALRGRFLYNKSEIKSEMYNTIKSLENSNYIKASRKMENGRSKNYYTLTEDGKNVLEKARKTFMQSIKEMASILGE